MSLRSPCCGRHSPAACAMVIRAVPDPDRGSRPRQPSHAKPRPASSSGSTRIASAFPATQRAFARYIAQRQRTMFTTPVCPAGMPFPTTLQPMPISSRLWRTRTPRRAAYTPGSRNPRTSKRTHVLTPPAPLHRHRASSTCRIFDLKITSTRRGLPSPFTQQAAVGSTTIECSPNDTKRGSDHVLRGYGSIRIDRTGTPEGGFTGP
jgi:hypothetical protein